MTRTEKPVPSNPTNERAPENSKPRKALATRPEHIHLLFSEPPGATPSKVMQVLKQRVSRRLRWRTQPGPAQLRLPWQDAQDSLPHFWQPRFYDFNVWSRKKYIEKLHYMHMNPLNRKLVTHPRDWLWSSFTFYARKRPCLIRIDPMR